MSAGGPHVPGSLKLLLYRYVHMFVYALSIISLFIEVRSDRVGNELHWNFLLSTLSL